MPPVVYCEGSTEISTESPEIEDLTSFPKNRPILGSVRIWIDQTVLGLPNDYPFIINSESYAVPAARKRTQVDDVALLPAECMKQKAIRPARSRRVGIANDDPLLIDDWALTFSLLFGPPRVPKSISL